MQPLLNLLTVEKFEDLISRVVSLLRRNRRVRIEFFDRSTSGIDIQSVRVRPTLIIETGNPVELKEKLCREILRDRSDS